MLTRIPKKEQCLDDFRLWQEENKKLRGGNVQTLNGKDLRDYRLTLWFQTFHHQEFLRSLFYEVDTLF